MDARFRDYSCLFLKIRSYAHYISSHTNIPSSIWIIYMYSFCNSFLWYHGFGKNVYMYIWSLESHIWADKYSHYIYIQLFCIWLCYLITPGNRDFCRNGHRNILLLILRFCILSHFYWPKQCRIYFQKGTDAFSDILRIISMTSLCLHCHLRYCNTQCKS